MAMPVAKTVTQRPAGDAFARAAIIIARTQLHTQPEIRNAKLPLRTGRGLVIDADADRPDLQRLPVGTGQSNPADHKVSPSGRGRQLRIHLGHDVVPDFFFNNRDLAASPLIRIANNAFAFDQIRRIDSIHRCAAASLDPDCSEGGCRHSFQG